METITIERKKKDGSISTTEYTPVNQRVLEFRTNPKYDGWQLITDIVSVSDTSVLFKASAINKDGIVMATGYAGEEKQTSAINNFNFIENGETSAVGRCLGFLGIFVDKAIASAEEVKNAIEKQESLPQQKNDLTGIQIKYGKFAGKKMGDLEKEELKELCNDKNEWLRNKANEYYSSIYNEEYDQMSDLIEQANQKEELPF